MKRMAEQLQRVIGEMRGYKRVSVQYSGYVHAQFPSGDLNTGRNLAYLLDANDDPSCAQPE
jgi:hypothetical protein